MTKPVHILLVEDNPGDVDLTRRALNGANLAISLHIVQDGVEALEFLYQRGKYTNAQQPDLILLDLNLPKKDGREVLQEIKTHPVLKRIPVIVLTTSQADEDILHAYDLHANSYITKPVSFPTFMETMRKFHDYWSRSKICRIRIK